MLDFQESAGRMDKDGGEIQGGLRPPSELCILQILDFLTDIKIKYNENIVGYIILHKNHLNSDIFFAKNVLLEFFRTALILFENAPPWYKKCEEA